MSVLAYFVRFKGHRCAGVKSGLSRKPILIRARKAESTFESPVVYFESEMSLHEVEECRRVARLRCARAIKRTENARRRLQGDHMLRGTPVVERLLRDSVSTRRGKRWKICPIEGPATSAEPQGTTEPTNK